MTGEKSTGPGEQKQVLGTQKGESFQTGVEEPQCWTLSPLLDLKGSQEASLCTPASPDTGQHCQPQLHFPSQEYSAMRCGAIFSYHGEVQSVLAAQLAGSRAAARPERKV